MDGDWTKRKRFLQLRQPEPGTGNPASDILMCDQRRNPAPEPGITIVRQRPGEPVEAEYCVQEPLVSSFEIARDWRHVLKPSSSST